MNMTCWTSNRHSPRPSRLSPWISHKLLKLDTHSILCPGPALSPVSCFSERHPHPPLLDSSPHHLSVLALITPAEMPAIAFPQRRSDMGRGQREAQGSWGRRNRVQPRHGGRRCGGYEHPLLSGCQIQTLALPQPAV